MGMEIALKEKLNNLKENLRSIGKVAVLFGGDSGSAFLLYIAKDVLGSSNVIAITANSAGMPQKELSLCKQRTAEIGIKHIVVRTREFMEESYLKNDMMRCYVCKIIMFKSLMPYVSKQYKALVGTIYEDFQNINNRPDILAENEFNVFAPLKEGRLLISDIRQTSKELGIEIQEKPHMSCLSTRIPFGSIITGDKIEMIEKAEEVLAEKGFKAARVFHYGNLAKIEIDKGFFEYKDIKNLIKWINKEFKRIGFKFVAIDLDSIEG